MVRAALTPKQERFVAEYLVDLNATAAYRRAGYKARGRSAENAASRLLGVVGVQQAIQAGQAARGVQTGITAARVLTELAKLAFSDMRSFTSWGPSGVVLRDSATLSADEAACVAEVSQTVTEGGGALKFKLHSKVDALDKLCRHLGVYNDRVHLEGELTHLIEIRETVVANRAQAADLPALNGAGGVPRRNGTH